MKLSRQFNILNTILFALLSFAIVGIPTFVSADQCGGITVGTPGLQQLCDSGQGSNSTLKLISGTANFIVIIIGSVGVLMIIISGIQMITSAGQPEAIKAAKKRLTTTIISLVVLVSMRVILNLIVIGSPF